MASSNPFRKSFAPAESRGRPGADGGGKENTALGLGLGLGLDGGSGDDVAKKKKKSAKKVRVLSPPPRSPGPREVLTSPPPPPTWSEAELRALGDAYPEGMGQGLGSPILMHPRPQAQTRIQWPVLVEAQNSPAAAGGQEDLETPVSANPFSRALHELGTGAGTGTERADKARRSLNVDSFRRLLMTGAASPPHSPPAPDPASSAAAGADGSTNGLHHDEPEALPAAAQQSREKKLPPPPPSSRHGRSLKADTKDPGLGATASHELLPSSATATEQTHPQPSMPHGSSSGSGSNNSSSSDDDDDKDDDDDNDDDDLSNDPIIKALELELNGSATTPDQEIPNPLASPAAPNSAKKPVPAPPPRRGHARTESKARGIQAALSPQHSDPPSRNSMDSERSAGAGSIRQSTAAPLPPPPRRPPIAPRQPSATPLPNPSSPSGPHNDHDHYTTAPEPSITLLGKAAGARPPPPPARQSSTARRPPGLLGVDPSSRRVSSDSKLRESMAPPPPPPPPSRHREGESSQPRSSVDMAHDTTRVRSSSSPTPDAGKSNDILADLDALQREVDALRGRIG